MEVLSSAPGTSVITLMIFCDELMPLSLLLIPVEVRLEAFKAELLVRELLSSFLLRSVGLLLFGYKMVLF